MPLIRVLSFISITCILFFACSKNGGSNNSSATVYVSGYIGTQGLSTTGTYWKNGSSNNFNNSSQTNSIIVSGKDIYVLDKTGYWKNGAFVPLPDAMGTTSFFVSGSDVYVSGFTTTSLNTLTAAIVYWKNGTLVDLTQNLPNVTAGWSSSIYVSGSDVYVAGIIGINYRNEVAVYWKNGNINYLPDGYMAKTIAVSGNFVYVAGTSLNNGDVYWLNGGEQILGGNANILASFVYNGDLYLAGFTNSGPDQATYWKNGVATPLPNGWQATGIVVNGSTVYACGNNNNGDAIYWKNGIVDTLGIGAATGIALGN